MSVQLIENLPSYGEQFGAILPASAFAQDFPVSRHSM
jgi:hypothetical protein